MRGVSRVRRLAWRVLLPACSVVLVAASAWLLLTALRAQDQLVAARAHLDDARDALMDARPADSRAALTSAGDRTRRARKLTSGPAWWAAGAVPVLGRTPATVRAVTAAADDLAREVLPPAVAAAAAVDVQRLRRPDGSVNLAVLQAAAQPARRSAGRADAVRAHLARLEPGGVVGGVGDARDELLAQTTELVTLLRGAAQALELTPALLGQDTPRRYLVLVQQTGESRGTGGLIGGYVLLEAAAGRLTVADSGSNAELPAGAVPPPVGLSEDFIRLYRPSGAFLSWQNANLSPDVPSVARVLEARWAARGGGALDGVVLLDAVALAHLLRGSGPIDVGGRMIEPDQLPEHLAVGQYADFAPRTGDVLDGVTARKDQLDRVAGAVARRLASGPGDTTSLLRGVAAAVRSGHLRMASDDSTLGPALAAAGVDGALPAGDHPVAYAVVNNASGGKLDHFLDRRVAYAAAGCDGERRASTVTVQLRNDVPADGLPPYLTTRITPQGRVDTRTSSLALTVYATPGAELVRATLDDRPLAPEDLRGAVLVNSEEAGLATWSLTLDLPPGAARTLRLELTEPVLPGSPVVPEQPLSRPLIRSVDAEVCR